MEQRNNNKTIMSSVFFLDIVEYSKESVVGQISLKDRFNKFLSSALENVPDADRIILDTGDGAAVSFIGDIEEALHAAFSLRENLLGQDVSIEPQLRVRMGINLGPVRLVRDINGQPNIVGDGINVAQRIMAFADINQILLSRSYYDAVSRLSPQYVGMFRYKGSHTDKHVREHEVYAICAPGEETVTIPIAPPPPPPPKKGRAKPSNADVSESPQGGKGKRLLYIGIGGVALVAGWLLTSSPSDKPNPVVNGDIASAVIPTSSVPPDKTLSDAAPVVPVPAKKAALPTANVNPPIKPSAPAPAKPAKPSLPTSDRKTNVVTPPPATAVAPTKVNEPAATEEGHVTISCAEGSHVYVDGSSKGKVGSVPLSISVPVGRHLVIVNSPTGVINQQVDIVAGKTVRVSSGSCN